MARYRKQTGKRKQFLLYNNLVRGRREDNKHSVTATDVYSPSPVVVQRWGQVHSSIGRALYVDLVKDIIGTTHKNFTYEQ